MALRDSDALDSARIVFAIHGDAQSSPQKAPKLRFADDASVDEVFAIILRSGLRHFLANLAAKDSGDPEAVHQMRVALRHLRSALMLLRKLAPPIALDGFRDDAKWLASGLNDARTWDVFLGETLPRIETDCPVVDFDALRALAARRRESAQASARVTLAERRAQRFQTALDEWIDQRGWRLNVSNRDLPLLAGPAADFAARRVKRQHRNALEHGRHFKRLAPKERHKLRLRLKKLRDATDAFRPLFGKHETARRYAKNLTRLQDCLGRFNDIVTTAQLMKSLPRDSAAERAVGAVSGWLAHEQASLESDVRKAWRRFRKSKAPR
jgi:CHAD domain-containing protein